jgi:hypothetical protein
LTSRVRACTRSNEPVGSPVLLAKEALVRSQRMVVQDQRVKQLVISVVCLLPAARAAVAHAELVALGVGHDHPPAAVLGSGMSVKTARADPFEAFDLGVDVGCLDVEVHAVLGELGLAHSLQKELGQRP